MQAGAEGDVVVDGFGEGVGFLEDHADAVVGDATTSTEGSRRFWPWRLMAPWAWADGDEVVHAVDPSEEGWISRSRRVR